MLDKKHIYIPINTELREQLLTRVSEDGFDSIQQLVRLFLTQYSQGKVNVGLVPDYQYETTHEEATVSKILSENGTSDHLTIP
jgi:hypothetical protein